jgi:hypothetical protein
MRGLWSQFEEAWRDTLVHRAEDRAFDSLSRLYGIPRPDAEVPERNWRGVLSQLAYGRRGTFGATYTSLLKAFAFLNEEIACTLDLSPQDGLCLEGYAWENKHLNRLVSIAGRLFFTQDMLNATTMRLVGVSTLYWEGSFLPNTQETQDLLTETSVQFIPFVVHERSPGRIIDFDQTGNPDGSDEFTVGEECLVEVVFFVVQEDDVPKTWLQDPTDYSDESTVYTQDGAPFGGQLLSDETEIGNPSGTGPYPLYLYDGAIFPVASSIFSSTLAASVELKAVKNPPNLGVVYPGYGGFLP